MLYDNRALVWLFRLGVFVGLLSAVVTVIYLTPVPELQHASCLRPCHELDWPMICRVKLVLETSTVVARSRNVCGDNTTDCGGVGGCLPGPRVRHKVITANGLLPGPTIEVCEKDILVVDIVNRVPGAAVSVHWRGQSQHDSPFMDGAPMITQCPIPSHTTFQYKFRANAAGTHLWQLYTGDEGLDAMFGALVVRQSPKRDPHHDLYDEDDYFVIISELPALNSAATDTKTLLVNGLPFDMDSGEMTHLNVTALRRHRLRIAYTVTSFNCPISVSVDNHPLLIITIDGHAIRPVEVQSISLAPGERVDAVLTADRELGEYLLTARTSAGCATRALGSAVITYRTDLSSDTALSPLPQHQSTLVKKLSTGGMECSKPDDSRLICLPKIESLTKIPPELGADRLDFTLYLPFDFVKPPAQTIFQEAGLVPRLNNLTLALPSSPLLSQLGEVDTESICSAANRPDRCANTALCECVHIVDIPLNTAVELVLVDQGGMGETVFHVHGYSLHVVAAVSGIGLQGVDTVKQLDARNQLFPRNLHNPVVKDTVSVPVGGVVAARFKADNPGYWLLHSERARGLGVILHVGTADDTPPVPDEFPTCASWVGPEFFLI